MYIDGYQIHVLALKLFFPQSCSYERIVHFVPGRIINSYKAAM